MNQGLKNSMRDNNNLMENFYFGAQGIMVQDPTRTIGIANPFNSGIDPFPEESFKITLNKAKLHDKFMNTEMSKEQYISMYNLLESSLDEDITLVEEILKTYE